MSIDFNFLINKSKLIQDDIGNLTDKMQNIPGMPSGSSSQDSADALEQLRDVHVPDPVSWWPPAPGWWALLAIILISIPLISIYRRYRKERFFNMAIEELGELKTCYYNAHEIDNKRFNLAEQLSILIKRIAIFKYGKDEVASLYGQEWLDFLDNKGFLLEGKAEELLINASYIPERYKVQEEIAEKLFKATESWIKKIK